jgi:hypothetical protein
MRSNIHLFKPRPNTKRHIEEAILHSLLSGKPSKDTELLLNHVDAAIETALTIIANNQQERTDAKNTKE